MLKKILLFTLLILTILHVVSCDSNETALNPDADIDYSLYAITMGAVEGSTAYVHIPGQIFGNGTALSGVTIEVYQNGKYIGSISQVSGIYASGANLVIFKVSGLASGDRLGFVINLSDSSSVSYEGKVSDEQETQAALGVLEADLVPTTELGAVGSLFQEKQTSVGDATAEDKGGIYVVTFGGYEYSADCEIDFVLATDFFMDSTLDADEAAQVLSTGSSAFDLTVELAQTDDGYLTWDELSSSGNDYSGVIYQEGSFEFFKGDYVNETNYRYTLIQGTVSDGQIIGDFVSVIVLDGQKLENGLVGSCTVTSSIGN